ncbi:hypothetical protein [Methanosarcina barkeri]|nr:hypothetical protein [Methanosarcina barkeri]
MRGFTSKQNINYLSVVLPSPSISRVISSMRYNGNGGEVVSGLVYEVAG